MSKQLTVSPKAVRKPGKLKTPDIPVNVYQKTVKDEKANYTKEEFLNIFRDMCYIREFETMLNLIKTTNEYNGISYNHPGPAHLSIGQEASVVGQAYLLDKDDYIFGSHRSHGEILAKGLSAIEKLSDDDLMDVMKTFFDGAILKVVEANRPEGGSIKDLAIDFLVYGTLAEIFARETGTSWLIASATGGASIASSSPRSRASATSPSGKIMMCVPFSSRLRANSTEVVRTRADGGARPADSKASRQAASKAPLSEPRSQATAASSRVLTEPARCASG